METVVIGFGGSILAPPTPDPERVYRLARALQEWSRERRVLVVVGGGLPARNAIAVARPSGADREAQDRIGIAATRLNAQTLIGVLRGLGADANHEVPTTTEAAAGIDQGIVVMGGTTPGHSTDFVAAELAIKAGATRFVIATNVDGVYTADPNKDPDAKHLPAVNHDRLLEIVGGPDWREAGAASIVDGPAAALLVKSRLEVRVVGGDDFKNIGQAVAGLDFHGTLITDGV